MKRTAQGLTTKRTARGLATTRTARGLTTKRTAPGLTMVELLTVLVLVALLSALAAPPLRDMLQRYQLNTASSALAAAVDLTRAQAIARGRRVMLVPLEPGGADWRLGWVVFVDADADRRPGPGEEVIASHPELPLDMVIRTHFSSNKVPAYVAFNSYGRGCSDSSSASARWGTLSLHLGAHLRQIRINMLGRVRICDPERESDHCPVAGKED